MHTAVINRFVKAWALCYVVGLVKFVYLGYPAAGLFSGFWLIIWLPYLFVYPGVFAPLVWMAITSVIGGSCLLAISTVRKTGQSIGVLLLLAYSMIAFIYLGALE